MFTQSKSYALLSSSVDVVIILSSSTRRLRTEARTLRALYTARHQYGRRRVGNARSFCRCNPLRAHKVVLDRVRMHNVRFRSETSETAIITDVATVTSRVMTGTSCDDHHAIIWSTQLPHLSSDGHISRATVTSQDQRLHLSSDAVISRDLPIISLERRSHLKTSMVTSLE